MAGLNHDPSVALLEDGVIKFAIESEKVTRHKHETAVVPEAVIRYVLEGAGAELDDIDVIATNWDAGPLANGLYLAQLKAFASRACLPASWIVTLVSIAGSHSRSYLRQFLPHVPKVAAIRHHLAHVGSCYTLSPFDEAVAVVFDGSGELECTSIYRCAGRKVKKLYSMDLPLDSLGHVYTLCTVHLGYARLGDEYKVMGLAAYGEERKEFAEFFAELIALLPDGRYRIDRRLAGDLANGSFRFPPAALRRVCQPRRPADEFTQEHKDFAKSLQLRIEAAILHVLRHAARTTGAKKLCLAGGVALNCVANGRVVEKLDFTDVFIQPAAHDAGTSLGAAAYYSYHVAGGVRPTPFRSPYLGPAFDTATIRSELTRCRTPYRELADPALAGAEQLARGRVLGWFQGRAEFGPRALGNRSILADPRSPAMKERVNQLVKERESYRPFAPALLAESMADYFTFIRDSPYMLLAGAVRSDRRADLGAVTHVDGTARPQSVHSDLNPRFHDLISNFQRFTGVPAVLNTSFNVAGEPIVLSPSDALRCFYASGLDALILDRFLVEKSPNQEAFADHA